MTSLSHTGFIIRLSRWIYRVPGWAIIIIGVLWKFSIDIFFASISSEKIGGIASSQYSQYYYLVIGLFLAPFIETAIFQFLPIEGFELLSKKICKKKNPLLAVIISALLFGLAHNYNSITMIATCFSGLALSSTYVIFKHKKGSIGHGFMMTVLLHFVVNLIINIAKFL